MVQSNLIAYDVGMYTGNDSDYYLSKGFKVIAIDADPEACEFCRLRFSSQIFSGQMTILNCGISDSYGTGKFFINETWRTISTFAPEAFIPNVDAPKDWRDPIDIKLAPLSGIIKKFGDPHFIKIDIEFYDSKVLGDLLENEIRPPLISAEAQNIVPLDLLFSLGYRKFRIVEGSKVGLNGPQLIRRIDGSLQAFEFKTGDAGPFGDDLATPWLDRELAEAQLRATGFGWVDIHASL